MSTLVVVRYGFVWCPNCGDLWPRETEIEPLPRCKNGCQEWTEPLLCDNDNCQAEAEVETEVGHYCQFHVK
jgi:hypothetical protein